MKRKALYTIALTSLLLSAALVVLWVRSHGGRDGVPVFGDSLRLHSLGGRVVAFALPRGKGTTGASAEQLALRLRTMDVEWVLHGPGTGGLMCGTGPSETLQPVGRTGSAAATVLSLPRDTVVPALLAALDDPDRFAAAHALLTAQWGDHEPQWDDPIRADGTATYNRLRMRMGPPGAVTLNSLRAETAYDGTWRADASQRAAIKAAWVARFYRPMFAIPYPVLIFGALLLPTASFLTAALRARHTRKAEARSVCPACGYDLRATPHRCPECGRRPVRTPPQRCPA